VIPSYLITAISVSALLVGSILGLYRVLTVIAEANQSPGFVLKKRLFCGKTGFWTKGVIGGCQRQTDHGRNWAYEPSPLA